MTEVPFGAWEVDDDGLYCAKCEQLHRLRCIYCSRCESCAKHDGSRCPKDKRP